MNNKRLQVNTDSFDQIFKSIANGITGVWVFTILTVFPIYTHDMYFDILGARYNFYKISILTQAILLLVLLLIYVFIDGKERDFYGMRKFTKAFHPKNIFTTLRLTDIIFVFLVIVFIISYVVTKYKKEAWTGSAGRYQGLECWLFYFLSYLLVTRTFKFKSVYLDWALVAGFISCQWGILDFYWINPFGFLTNVSGEQKLMFASSIGNYNTYTNYVSMLIALCATMFCSEKKLWKSIVYGVLLQIFVYATITGVSDNAALGLLAVLGFLPFYCFKDRRGLGRYFILIAEVVFGIAFMHRSLTFKNGGRINQFVYSSSIFKTLGEIKYIYLFAIIAIVFAVAINLFLYFEGKNRLTFNELSRKKSIFDMELPKYFFGIWIVIFLLTVLGGIFVILDVNVWHNFPQFRNLGFSNFLIFNDDWGTHRGHNWRIAIQTFQKFPLINQLFGHGPETYLIVTERNAYEEMVTRYGEVYDSAHNEYLHYLICEGILGVTSYLAFFISGIVRAFRKALDNPYVMACIFAVVAYMVQAIVNIAIPITTPIFFTLFYMAIAYMNEIEIEQIKLKRIEEL